MTQELIVSIEEGHLRGKICYDYTGGQYFSFQGIPYAKPPLGPLRFKAPQPPEPWKEIRDATTEGNMCYHRSGKTKYVGAEDCLFLNVYTPTLPIKDECSLKPVMFWIHAGGYEFGSGNTSIHGPDYLISQDVVIVTINYRLGLLGFLSLEDPGLGIPGNAGLKDQVMALRWVQRNIRQFCGDPNNVTICGESTGGASVHYMMLSPMTKGLFHKAIMQSGTALDYWSRGQSSATLIAEALELQTVNEREILKILQDLSVEELYKIQEKIPEELIPFRKKAVGFVVEKQTDEPAFLSEDPIDLIQRGAQVQVPVIIGYASREGSYFEMYCKNKYGKYIVFEDFEKYIPNTLKFQKGSDLSKSIASRIKSLYFGEQEPNIENRDDTYVFLTDVNFLQGVFKTIESFSMTSSAPLYLYRMSVSSKLNIYKNLGKLNHPGACHGDDLGYLFKTIFTPKGLGNIEKEGIQRFIRLWANFARTGDPNPKGKDSLIEVTWTPMRENELNYLEIGENLTVGINPDAKRMQFWNEIYAISDTNAKL
ncbi:hypothetical protein ILUMI_07460 [Ignelater luminosus]|uniref:Carboxylesterase type B domain-containing protein n=1 Tax=Ignelater luminosus TaxID=2038154 RepID=A0A8K0D3F6_IGNLU|nr:hypothetical protein ILUMI_07460 [Ignelater luminosus]